MANPHTDGIDPGRLDRRIEIQAPVRTENALGEPETTGWSTVARPYAEFVPQRMGEAFEAAREVARRRAAFFIHWRMGLSEEMRVVFDDGTGAKAWDIRALDQIGYRQGWRIIAEAIT